MTTMPKDIVCLQAVYKGTAIPNLSKRSAYTETTKQLKMLTKQNIAILLQEHGTKDKVADAVQQLLDVLESQITKHKYVTWETLEETWGKDYETVCSQWTMYVSMLLSLKRIKNDNMNGWLLQDHNSTQYKTADGPVIAVHGTDNDVLTKKIQKILANSK